MFFKDNKKFKSVRIKRNVKSYKKYRKPIKKSAKKQKKSLWGRLFVRIIVIGFLLSLIPMAMAAIWFKNNVLDELPDISKIESVIFAQTSVITDKNGEVLYKLFEENREYVGFDQISENMVNAIVATEDKNFWTNPGIDIYGIIRAGWSDLTNPNEPIHGGSTLTQQLIKNLLLTREKKIKRKLKEIVLALQLNSYIKGNLQEKYPDMGDQKADRKVKEKILELYLNYIPFSNNAYGVEAAAKTYFGTSAQNLDVLQSSILAGIPQAPSRYNPFTNKDAVMGYLKITNKEGNKIQLSALTGDTKQIVINKVESILDKSTFTFNQEAQSFIRYIRGLLTFESAGYDIEYIPGRKDAVLARMYEEGYVEQQEVKDALLEGLTFNFHEYRIDIKAPHFVFWVIQQLKDQYGEEALMKGGWTIKTSLDMDIQNMAQQSLNKNMEYVNTHGGNNSAMLYMDTKTGEILAYVGSADYNDEEIDGKVDMVQAQRQPGSTMKPLIYTLGFMKNNFALDTPIYDIEMEIGPNKPQNVDGKFLGLMPLRKALAYSRNIPAIKMYFIAGQDPAIKEFLGKIGLHLNPTTYYGYPLAIGAAEVKMMELANAFGHLSALGKPAKINPILEIRGPDGELIYKKNLEQQEQVIPAGIAYMIRNILSDKSNFPPSWVSTYTYEGFPVATKSGTTNVVLKSGRKLPRDGWLVAYTPSKVAVFWAGNTKGEPLNASAYGGWLNRDTWKGFFGALEAKQLIGPESMSAQEVKSVAISKISGKPASNITPLKFIENSMAYIEALPDGEDDSVKLVQVDSLCNGKVTEKTPESEIIEGYLINPTTIMSDGRDLEDVNEWWIKEGATKYEAEIGKPVFLNPPDRPCTSRPDELTVELVKPTNNQTINSKFYIWFRMRGPSQIKNARVYIDNTLLTTFQDYEKAVGIGLKELTMPGSISEGNHKIKVIVEDIAGETDSQEININYIKTSSTNNGGGDDTTGQAPYLDRGNSSMIQKSNGMYEITLMFKDDDGYVQSGRIYQRGFVLDRFDGNMSTFEAENIERPIKYEVKDNDGNIVTKELDLQNF